MRQEAFSAIARQIESRIKSDPSYRLPRLVDLAGEWHVSYPTIWKALQLLVNKGVVKSMGGRRLVVSAHAAEQASPYDRLYGVIKDRIQDGIYKVGRPLPKSGYFISTEKTSGMTVARVFARLAAEGLVHKRGNHWHAGPASAVPTPMVSVANSPVILAVLEGELAFDILGGAFNDRFMEPFVHEASSHGLQIRTALLSGQSGSAIGLPTGATAIREFVRDLGSRYRGTLIRGMQSRFFPEVAELISALVKMRKPVVYFDSTGEGSNALTRTALSVGRGYHRLHLHERAAVMLVLERLSRLGHRVIGVHGAEVADWARRRADLIVECAKLLDPPVHIAIAGPAEREWRYPNKVQGITFVEQLLGAKQPAGGLRAQEGNAREALIRGAPSLVALITDHRPTALVGLNDDTAWEYFLWFRSIGVDIPKHLSIVGFDNIAPTALLPLASVDWGFPRLGYLAAHCIIGDIPVHAGRSGDIAGTCTLSGAMSIGAPADPAELVRLLRQ